MDVLLKAEDDVKAGRSPKAHLAEAQEEVNALSALGIKNPANADRMKSATEAIGAARQLAN